jgi:flagellar motility protein MotE (MotC chaperone)
MHLRSIVTLMIHGTRRHAAGPRARLPGGKPRRELQALRKQASKLYDEVHSGEVEPKAGAVFTQITNTQARILELERKLKETEELEERLEVLEQAQHQKADNRWQA